VASPVSRVPCRERQGARLSDDKPRLDACHRPGDDGNDVGLVRRRQHDVRQGPAEIARERGQTGQQPPPQIDDIDGPTDPGSVGTRRVDDDQVDREAVRREGVGERNHGSFETAAMQRWQEKRNARLI
jgi:hypothetical protein